METNKPVEVYREGTVQAAVFEREVEGPDGKFTSRSVALQTGFKKDGQWENRRLTLTRKDIAKAILVLTKAEALVASA